MSIPPITSRPASGATATASGCRGQRQVGSPAPGRYRRLRRHRGRRAGHSAIEQALERAALPSWTHKTAAGHCGQVDQHQSKVSAIDDTLAPHTARSARRFRSIWALTIRATQFLEGRQLGDAVSSSLVVAWRWINWLIAMTISARMINSVGPSTMATTAAQSRDGKGNSSMPSDARQVRRTNCSAASALRQQNAISGRPCPGRTTPGTGPTWVQAGRVGHCAAG